MATKKKEKNIQKYLNEKETIILVKDNERYSNDLTVTYNGKNYLIKRGVPVEIPRFLKLVIEDAYRQQMMASDFSRKLEEEFMDKSESIERGGRA